MAEFRIRTGPRDIFGLLGAEFVPSDADTLEVEILCSEDTTAPFEGSLSDGVDRACLGLPEEYANAIVSAITTQPGDAALKLGSGRLRFDCAAHGEVGSSQFGFSRLTGILLELLAVEDAGTSPESLSAIFERTFLGRAGRF